ncbi:Maf family protein [Methylophaga sp.]|uniref:Maf family protein n=1 Tax=Methylophaga sp. TaxID=2024840 RepID=UPI003F69F315
MQQLILGSSSPFRAELLSKLNMSFIQASPEIDETPQAGEKPAMLVKRLAEQKAIEIAKTHPDALIIGSDQVAVIDEAILGKPGNHQNAVKQLKQASGREVKFLTGLALYNAQTQNMQSLVEPFSVHFRQLTDEQIAFYLKKEQPYQCAGSFKSEGFGISLFSKLMGDDPNSLIGLPLIRLIELLRHEKIDVLQPSHP